MVFQDRDLIFRYDRWGRIDGKIGDKQEIKSRECICNHITWIMYIQIYIYIIHMGIYVDIHIVF